MYTSLYLPNEAQEMIDMQQEEIIQLSKFLHERGEPNKINKH